MSDVRSHYATAHEQKEQRLRVDVIEPQRHAALQLKRQAGTHIEADELVVADKGNELNEKWGVGALHALYRKDGSWYHTLNKFPGALFDENGYILFKTQQDYELS